MSHVLIVSVGFSPEPIINCINDLRPDRVVFLCSQGTSDKIDAILSQTSGFDFDRDRDLVIIDGPQQRLDEHAGVGLLDRLDHTYLIALDVMSRIDASLGRGDRITVDFAGGTKAMTAGLAMAAIDNGKVDLYITTAKRQPGQAAISGRSSPRNISTTPIQARRLFDLELPALLARFDYEAARQAVRRILQLPSQEPESRALLTQLEQLLKALDAWDRFDHNSSLELLQALPKELLESDPVRSMKSALERIMISRDVLGKDLPTVALRSKQSHGFEVVEDLILNAHRRAAQSRFDDAVGRIYRALELTAQIFLRKDYDLKTGELRFEAVSPHLNAGLHEAYRKKLEIRDGKFAARDSFELLADFEHPAGVKWRQDANGYISRLTTRNESLFAHGFTPITVVEWNHFYTNGYKPFLDELLAGVISSASATPLSQLPTSLMALMPAG